MFKNVETQCWIMKTVWQQILGWRIRNNKMPTTKTRKRRMIKFWWLASQWLNYSEVGGGTLQWPKLQCYTKTILTKTNYVYTLMVLLW